MVLWLLFAVMAVAAAVLLLRPLMLKYGEIQGRPVYEAAIYREQLQSLQNEVDQGMLGADEAKGARSEIGRRLLATADAQDSDQSGAKALGSARTGRAAAAILVMLFVPLSSLGFYSMLGNPSLPSVPAAARMAATGENQSIDELVARVEKHLAANPDDVRGWEVLAPTMMRLRRYDEAAVAFQRIIDLSGPNANTLSMLGEALMFAQGGIIGDEALKAFTEAAAIDTALPDPRFYLGVASLQNQDKDGAIAIWRKLLEDSPADAPWRDEIEAQIAQAQGLAVQSPPGPGADEIAAADQMSAEERQAMIANMVAGLDTRLRENGGSAEEWLRLANAYRVMNKGQERDDVIARARKALSADPDALSRFEAGINTSDKG